jgi:hypothetical protein
MKKDKNVENYQQLENNIDKVIEKVKRKTIKTILNMLII